MSDLTPEQLAQVDATVDRVRAERADARIMADRADAAYRRADELHAETVRQRRRIAALEDRIRARDARIAELEEKVAADLTRGLDDDEKGPQIVRTPAAPTPEVARAAEDALGPLWEDVVGPAVDYLQEHRAEQGQPPLYGRDVAALTGAVALAIQAYREQEGARDDAVYLQRLRSEDGVVDITLRPPEWFLTALADAARTVLKHAENYVVYTVRDTRGGARYDITVQRPDGMTPHEARQRAEARVAELEAKVAALSEALDEGAGEPVHAAPRCSDPAGAACCGVRLTLDTAAAALLADVLAVHPHPTLRQILTALEVR